MLKVFVYIIKFTGIAICVFMIYHILTRKFVNPYKLIFLFGKKGSGKSTLLAKLTARYLRRGWTVYSTEVSPDQDQMQYHDQDQFHGSINGIRSSSGTVDSQSWDEESELADECSTRTVGAGTIKLRRSRSRTDAVGAGIVHFIDPSKIYKYNFPRRSCIFIDEVSLIWDNRDFKHMDKKIIEWFRYQRKHGCRVYFFSQTFDIDKKLRDLADEMYLVNKYFRVLVVASHIVRKPVVVHPGPESPARIDDDMVVDGPLLTFFGGKIFAWIPYWAKRYDTNAMNVTVRKEELESIGTIEQNKNSAPVDFSGSYLPDD